MESIEIIGYIGAIAFTFCGLPMAWECFKIESARTINKPFLWLWLLGNSCLLLYAIHHEKDPLILDYSLNAAFLVVIFYYYYKDVWD